MSRSNSHWRSPLRADRASSVVALTLGLALSACRCGEDPTLITIFTDVVYTKDGKSLVLHATDGVYVAHPVDSTPQRVSEKGCDQSKTKSLDCVRISPDGTRLAVLGDPKVAGALTTFTLLDLKRPPGSDHYDAREVGSGILEAAVSQDGSHLVFSKAGAVDSSVDLFQVALDGTTTEIVHQLPLGSELTPDQAIGALVVTPYGIAYPWTPKPDSLEARFRPWDQMGFHLGTLVKDCAGAVFPLCVLASADGTTVVWQESAGAVVHAYKPQADVDMPLGTGYAYTFSKSGSFVLRMDSGPYTAEMQSAANAVVVREVVGAASAQLSEDGETLAYLKVESKLKQTWRLFVGASRREGQEKDLGVFSLPTGTPLLAPSIGDAPIGFSLTGDARFVILDAPPDQAAAGASLKSVNTETGEVRTLDTLTCEGCCTVAPAGALVACIPTMSHGSVSSAAPIDIYDPATGLKTHATDKAILLEALSDGGGVAVLEYKGDIPELLIVTKDGRTTSLGGSLRVAAAPDRRQIARISELGRLSVETLP